MLKQLLQEQRRNLDHFFDYVDSASMEKVCNRLLFCKGTLFFSGVGKSGHIAEKLAATFSSTGTRSFYLTPANALHGDIGVIAKGDVCFFLSKSGETRELLELVPHVKQKGAFCIAVVSTSNSTLAKVCDENVLLPVKQELCPYGLAPTTSTTVQLIFGDCLAIALMQAKKFTLSDFATNHPSGVLGRKITLKVSDLMLKNEALPLCHPLDLTFSVLHELSQKRCGCVLIVTDNILQGIFTDGDLRRAIETHGADVLQSPISALMTKNPRSISSDKLAIDATLEMEKGSPVTVLPVIENERLVGLIRMHDILKGDTDATYFSDRLSSHRL